MSPTHLPIPDCCARAGIGRSTLYLALRSGALAARKIGRRTVIEVAELDRWMASAATWKPANA